MNFQIKLVSAKLEKRAKEEALHLATKFQKWGITPNGLTTAGLLVNLTAAYCVLRSQLALGALFLALGGFVDLLDGTLARISGAATKFGMFWDLVADRIAEAFFYIALVIYFVTSYNYFSVVFALFAMAGSWLITYTRSCADGLKIKVSEDLLPQPERIIILAVTLLFNRVVFGLLIIAMLTVATVVWRILAIYRYFQTKLVNGSDQPRKSK
jgi:phosphatidylglycerophosphate synthase